jgi:hypothetical protein
LFIFIKNQLKKGMEERLKFKRMEYVSCIIANLEEELGI